MKSFLFISLLFFSVCCSAQAIDSVNVSIGNPVSIVHIKGSKPDMELSNVTIVSLNDSYNTQIINLYFKGCPLNQIILPYDTTISLTATAPFVLQISAFHDTSSDCAYPAEPMLTDTFRLNVAQISGIGELEEDDINVFQNQANNSVKISAKMDIERIYVFSMDGKKIMDNDIKKSDFTIDLSTFAKGSYFLLLETKSKNGVTQKRIKRIFLSY